MIQVQYLGGHRDNLRGHVTKRSYGAVDRHAILQVFIADADYSPALFKRV